nr:hypothetical protein BaRGS_002800 [Batillaria attramentaria]
MTPNDISFEISTYNAGSSKSGKRFWQVTTQDVVSAMEQLRTVKRSKKNKRRRGASLMSIRCHLLSKGFDVNTQQVKASIQHAVQEGMVEDITIPIHRRYALPAHAEDEQEARKPGCSDTPTWRPQSPQVQCDERRSRDGDDSSDTAGDEPLIDEMHIAGSL